MGAKSDIWLVDQAGGPPECRTSSSWVVLLV